MRKWVFVFYLFLFLVSSEIFGSGNDREQKGKAREIEREVENSCLGQLEVEDGEI